ncbi:hypothetical protein BW716_21655 [[Flexibacter] sp. ATCC 35208]|nr:hypothetical protein BW716_21655 [[Flexibacter] sp. ATCC 35208]
MKISTMKIIFTCLLLITLQQVRAQSILSGKVSDESGNPIELATITLLKTTDTSYVAVAVSDINGAFSFKDLKEKDYFIRISHLSFEKKEMAVTPGVNINVLLGKSSAQLSEVAHHARKPLFVKEKDRLIFNVENGIISSSQSDLISLIRNLPGIFIDHQQNILLNGQEKVLVTVNDRSVYMKGGDLMQYLKTIPVNIVKSIEVIAHPSAKYDAEGTAVINIRTKSKIATGLAGNLSVGTGSSLGYDKYYPRHNAGVNLSLGQQLYSLYANYSVNYKESLGDIHEKLSFYQNSSLEQNVFFENIPDKVHNYSAGIDIKPTARQSISLFYSGSNNSRKVDQVNAIRLKTNDTITDVSSTAIEHYSAGQNAVNLVYRNSIDSANTITFSSDYLSSHKNNLGDYYNEYTKGNNWQELVRNNSFTNIMVWATQLDYAVNLKKGTKLDAGLKYSHVATKNNVEYSDYINNEFKMDSLKSNAFRYKENLIAAYVEVNTHIKKLEIKAGLRYEDDKVNGNSTVNQFRVSRDMSGLFPSLSLNYPLNKAWEVGAAYARRIARPNYVDINPFVYYVNPYVALEGNPSLLPAFTNKITVNAQWKQMYTAALTVFRTTNYFTTAQFQNVDTKEQKLKPANIGDLTNIDLNIAVPLDITKWWESYFDVNLAYQKFAETGAKVLGYPDNSRVTLQLFTQHSFALPKGTSLEFSNTLITPSVQGQFKFSTICSFSAGAKKTLLKDKIELKLSVSDFLKTLKYVGTLQGVYWKSNYQEKADNRQLILTLKYNFINKGKVKVKKPAWISNDEKTRMK